MSTEKKEGAPVFWIDKLPVYGDLILAPMDGVSDLPFRQLVHELGSSLSYTEFITAVDVLYGHPHLEQRLAFAENERPVVYQLMDNDPDRLLKSALILRKRNPDVIDINMGCYARSVVGRGAGAALLREPQKIAEIFKKLSGALDIPVTGKIRLGWDDDSLNYMDVAHAIEDNGGKMLAVHGRTRHQAYGGKANWDAIAQIKMGLSIPVLGNGDVQTVADIEQMKTHTGCDGVMIGRAAIENPWLFRRMERDNVPVDVVYETIVRHLGHMATFYGSERGLVLFRKFAKRYLESYVVDQEQMRFLLTRTLIDEFIASLDQYFPTTQLEQLS